MPNLPLEQNIEWLNANANRNYPLEDYATRQDVSGTMLPNGLIADLHVWFPASLGSYAFISSVTVTANLISVTIAAHTVREFQATSTVAFTPLAAVTVQKPTEQGMNYRLTPMVPGVGGWITFGMLVDDLAASSYRFVDPKATGILPRLARGYAASGVTSIGKPNYSTALQGIVSVLSSSPDRLVVERELVDIAGNSTEALVFRLNEEVAGREIYQQFPGVCGGVVESDSCGYPQINSINGAVPTCRGVIDVYISEAWPAGGAADLVITRDSVNATTLNLDYNRGLSAVCKKVPDELAVKGDDNCDDPCVNTGYAEASPLEGVNGDAEPVWLAGSAHTGLRYEPGQERGNSSFVWTSTTLSLDVSLIDTLTFNGTSSDLVLLIPSTSSVTQSPSVESYNPGDAVTITIPENFIAFNNTHGWFMSKEIITETASSPVTAAKTITDGDAISVNIPEGSDGNHGMGSVSGLGIGSVAFGTVFTIAELIAKGLVVGNTFSAKMVHIVMGSGFGNLEIWAKRPRLDSDAACTPSSSSSS